MDRAHNRSRSVLKTIRKWMFFFFIACDFLFIVGCNSKQSEDNEIRLKTNGISLSKWSDVFGEDEIIPFTQNGKEFEFISFGAMEISPKGDYIIVDGKQGKIFQFDSTGRYIRNIGNQGEGPGEYNIITAMDMDNKNNIYIFDIPAMKVNEYTEPDYNFKRQIKLGQLVQDIIVTDDGDFIFYFTSGNQILYKTDNQGAKIRTAFKPKQERLQLFISRFNLGRFCRVTPEDFLFLYPEEYKIYLFDNNLNIKKKYIAGTPSRFYPFISQFPNDLSPYEFSPKHSKWWSETLHQGRIFYLGNQFFIVVLFEYNNLSLKVYLNIHDLSGNTYAEGIELPFDGMVRYAKDKYIYVVENDQIDEKGNILPLKLHRFKLKI